MTRGSQKKLGLARDDQRQPRVANGGQGVLSTYLFSMGQSETSGGLSLELVKKLGSSIAQAIC